MSEEQGLSSASVSPREGLLSAGRELPFDDERALEEAVELVETLIDWVEQSGSVDDVWCRCLLADLPFETGSSGGPA